MRALGPDPYSPPGDRRRRARAALGQEFQTAWADGLRMSADEAIADGIPSSTSGGKTQSAGQDRRIVRLTPRERDVASLIARGFTSPRVAEILVISERTADAHADNIRGKLGLHSRAEIAAWAVEHGLARPGPEPSGRG